MVTSAPNASGLVLLPMTLAWIVWLALGARALWLARASTTRADWVRAGALFAGALALRLAAPGVPHDINPRSDEVFLPWDHLQWRYTHGLVALMRAVWALGAIVDDRVVFGVVAVAGALSVPLVDLATRRLGGGKLGGLLAAIVLGGIGLHVRYSHTDAPQIVEIATTLTAAVVALSSTPRTRLDLVWIGLSLGLAASMRPEGMAVPVLLALASWGWGLRWTRQELLALGALVTAVAVPDLVGLTLAQGSPTARGAGLDQGHGALTWGLRHFAPFNTSFVPIGVGLWILAAPWGRAGSRRGWTTLALMLALGSLVANASWSIGASPSWCLARHQLRVLPWMAVLVGLGVEGVVDRLTARVGAWTERPISVATTLGIAALTATTLPDAYSRFTLAEEYAFIRAHLPQLDDGCTVVTEREVTDQGLMLRDGLASVPQRLVWKGLADPLPASGCVVYYRSGLCTASWEGTPLDRCAEFERTHTLVPIAEAEIVARGWLWERFSTPTIRVGYFRVTDSTKPDLE